MLFVCIKMTFVIAWRILHIHVNICAEVCWQAAVCAHWTVSGVTAGTALIVNMIQAEDLLLMLMISVTGLDLRAQL